MQLPVNTRIWGFPFYPHPSPVQTATDTITSKRNCLARPAWSDSLTQSLKTPRKILRRQAWDAVQSKEPPAVRMRLTAPGMAEKLMSDADAQAASGISRHVVIIRSIISLGPFGEKQRDSGVLRHIELLTKTCRASCMESVLITLTGRSGRSSVNADAEDCR